MTFSVTQKHIDEGNDSYGGCPIALSIKETLNLDEYNDCVFVGYKDVVIYKGDKRSHYPLPSFVISWITIHDAHFPGTSPKPLSFELEIA